MKPICPAEAKWKYWRYENPKSTVHAGFYKWMKRQMNRAKRRWWKSELRNSD